MGGSDVLPDRSDVGDKTFSPFIDRVSLIVLSIAGIVVFPVADSSFESVLGGYSQIVTICGLVVVIPLLATWIGKINVRIRA